ncbi:MAG: hypothetical protein J5949_04855 [Oscillospiraceae bacterium]|nr:hypothetical protein [Oscillospiraceae bacterium]
MSEYTDDNIREMKKVTIQAAAQYLGISPMAVTLGMKNALLPIGFAVKNDENEYFFWNFIGAVDIPDDIHEQQKGLSQNSKIG